MKSASVPAAGIALLRLHTDDKGIVWAGDDAQLGVSTQLDVRRFFASDVLTVPWARVRSVRLLGVPENALLVCAIQQQRAADPELIKTQKVYLASPMAVGKADRSDIQVVLQTLWQPSATSNLSGHWHEMTTHDLCAYGMLVETAKAGRVSDTVRRIAAYHPAWPAVTFAPTVNVEVACQLLNDILDPRWFVHPVRPHRLTRLYAYLGLDPRNVAAVLDGGPKGYNFNRAWTAVRSWYDPARPPGPEEFPGRTYHAVRNRTLGVLQATRQFVAFIARVWLTTTAPAHPEAVFLPDRFFHDKAEADAFDRHRKRARKN